MGEKKTNHLHLILEAVQSEVDNPRLTTKPHPAKLNQVQSYQEAL